MTFEQWCAAYPEAARSLTVDVLAAVSAPTPDSSGKSESWSQQHVRFEAARQGALAWRNNVGATPAKCKACGTPQQPVRYGLANDSEKMNKVMKSSDLILAIPRTITADMVGQTVAQFGAVECKRPGWRYVGDERERAQAAWLAIIRRAGGFAAFSTGDIKL